MSKLIVVLRQLVTLCEHQQMLLMASYMNYWHSDFHDSVCQMDGISEIVRTFILLWSTVSYVHQEYLMEGITIHHGQYSGWPFVLNDHDHRQLVRIICGNGGQHWLRFHSHSLQEAPLTCSVRQFNILYLAEDSPGLHLLTRWHQAQHFKNWQHVAWSDDSQFQFFQLFWMMVGFIYVANPMKLWIPSCQ